MLTLEAYINRAIENNELQSDRHLGRVLSVSPSTVAIWRAGKSLPTDATMIKLADLADITREQALLELSYWRAGTEAQTVYKSLLSKIAGVGILLTFIFTMTFQSPAYAAPIAKPTTEVSELYIIIS